MPWPLCWPPHVCRRFPDGGDLIIIECMFESHLVLCPLANRVRGLSAVRPPGASGRYRSEPRQAAIRLSTGGPPPLIPLARTRSRYERSVETLSERVGRSIANASQHMQQLRRAGLMAARRDGKFVFYRLADDALLALLAALRQVAERNLAEVDRILRGHFANRDSKEPVSREDWCGRAHAL